MTFFESGSGSPRDGSMGCRLWVFASPLTIMARFASSSRGCVTDNNSYGRVWVSFKTRSAFFAWLFVGNFPEFYGKKNGERSPLLVGSQSSVRRLCVHEETLSKSALIALECVETAKSSESVCMLKRRVFRGWSEKAICGRSWAPAIRRLVCVMRVPQSTREAAWEEFMVVWCAYCTQYTFYLFLGI